MNGWRDSLLILTSIIILTSNPVQAGENPVPQPTPLDWSQFNDSVLLKVKRPAKHKIGSTVCSGVIIHPRALLTTAHCGADATEIKVVFDVEKGDQALQFETVAKKNIFLHPGYHPKKSLFENDLALLILEKAAPLDEVLIRKIPQALSLHSGDHFVRIGMGMRNGKNARNFTDPVFLKILSEGVFESTDLNSFFGDSGGPIYTADHSLLAIHSTLDDQDGKSTPHVYSVYLPHFRAWINSTLKKHGQTELKY